MGGPALLLFRVSETECHHVFLPYERAATFEK
jgi:hypothetical protein